MTEEFLVPMFMVMSMVCGVVIGLIFSDRITRSIKDDKDRLQKGVHDYWLAIHEIEEALDRLKSRNER